MTHPSFFTTLHPHYPLNVPILTIRALFFRFWFWFPVPSPLPQLCASRARVRTIEWHWQLTLYLIIFRIISILKLKCSSIFTTPSSNSVARMFPGTNNAAASRLTGTYDFSPDDIVERLDLVSTLKTVYSTYVTLTSWLPDHVMPAIVPTFKKSWL